MRNYWFRAVLILSLVAVYSLFSTAAFAVTDPAGGEAATLEGVAPGEVDSVLATLSDEQVRSLLIEELKKDAALQPGEKGSATGFVGRVAVMLHTLDGDGEVDISQYLARTKRTARSLPAELDSLLRGFSPDSSRAGGWRNIGLVLLVLSAGFLVELLFRLMTGRVRNRFMDQIVPDLSVMMRFWASLLRVLPAIIHVAVFGIASLMIFILTPLEQMPPVRYLFMALLFIVVAIRFISVLSQLFFSPGFSSLRLTPISDSTAARTHGVILFLTSYTVVGVAFLALARELGLQDGSLSLLGILLATVLLLLVAGVVFINRKPVAEAILSGCEEDGEESWVMQMFASLWHVLVLCYLFMVWFFMLFQRVQGHEQDKGAFLFSLLLIPAFLIMNWLAKWVIRSVVHTMRIYDPSSIPDDENLATAIAEQQTKKRLLIRRIQRGARVVILATLGAWGLKLWGYRLPYAAEITGAVFDSLVTLVLALMFWRFASSYIERKIKEATPEEEENKDEDDEWGAAGTRGRSYTLLPMVRKFIGTVLVVMVTLIILSSMGMDIGPLLAGAGVLGLAIGFGAQKLVADVFSGFFYLLDDAFRVGEYLQAGSVSGAVEAITLRNVMLRHHRGMLQIVPYSELGAITNFMRGGIVVKFNLEFPYDSDIDKIRKIIKKVGQAMLKDEEFGEDFIRPVKSQGVREITSSVMIIRVKFTAKPGTHFVIRREAYRRITEALAAKGIHYAHRKVIVELPEGAEQSAAEKSEQIKELGAAAGLAAIEEEEAKKAAAAGKSNSGPTIPGM